MNSGLVYHEIVPVASGGSELPRNSIAGKPCLPPSIRPECTCGQRMVLFLQFTVREQFGLPFLAGSHFCCFMCPDHNGIPQEIGGVLTADFWAETNNPNRSDFEFLRTPEWASYCLYLFRPDVELRAHEADGMIAPSPVEFVLRDEVVRFREEPGRGTTPAESRDELRGWSAHDVETFTGVEAFKIGGHPTLIEYVPRRICCCGAPMVFVAQVPFPSRVFEPTAASDHPSLRNSLFNDNLVHFFACSEQCDPRAVCVSVDG